LQQIICVAIDGTKGRGGEDLSKGLLHLEKRRVIREELIVGVVLVLHEHA
jgi:hypothetical protein